MAEKVMRVGIVLMLVGVLLMTLTVLVGCGPGSFCAKYRNEVRRIDECTASPGCEITVYDLEQRDGKRGYLKRHCENNDN